MSQETWIAEFYPTAAADCPKELAVEHSLRKWKGLTAEGMAKHGVTTEPLDPHAATCALCVHYFDEDADKDEDEPCAACPLAQHLGYASRS